MGKNYDKLVSGKEFLDIKTFSDIAKCLDIRGKFEFFSKDGNFIVRLSKTSITVVDSSETSKKGSHNVATIYIHRRLEELKRTLKQANKRQLSDIFKLHGTSVDGEFPFCVNVATEDNYVEFHPILMKKKIKRFTGDVKKLNWWGLVQILVNEQFDSPPKTREMQKFIQGTDKGRGSGTGRRQQRDFRRSHEGDGTGYGRVVDLKGGMVKCNFQEARFIRIQGNNIKLTVREHVDFYEIEYSPHKLEVVYLVIKK